MSRPFALVTPSDGVARVFYSGASRHIHELRLEPGQGWFDADLTKLGNGPETEGDPFACVSHPDGLLRVFYSADDKHVHELRLPPGQGWFDADLSLLASSH